jgi:hypothetical protein
MSTSGSSTSSPSSPSIQCLVRPRRSHPRRCFFCARLIFSSERHSTALVAAGVPNLRAGARRRRHRRRRNSGTGCRLAAASRSPRTSPGRLTSRRRRGRKCCLPRDRGRCPRKRNAHHSFVIKATTASAVEALPSA